MAKITVFLDPGHGGSDPGACGHSLKEALVVLPICQHIRTELLKHEISVVMSRSTDVAVDLYRRASMANEAGANLLVSVHCNAAGAASATGTETFTHPYDVPKTDALAKTMTDRIAKEFGLANRGAKEADFAVLRQSVMPAILVETAFISNINDAALLRNKQELFAKCIAEEILRYFGITCNGHGTVTPPAPTPEGITFYRVVVGSYEGKPAAQAVCDKLIKEGYKSSFLDAFKKDGKTFFRVIAGSFSVKASAEALKVELTGKGYSGVFLTAFTKGGSTGTVTPPPSTPAPPKPAPPTNTKRYINLKPHVTKWNVYNLKSAPVSGNQCGTLSPSQFGGLSYEILKTSQTDVYEIQTSSFGRVKIYVPVDNDSTFTSSPVYSGTSSSPAPSKQYINLKPHNATWSVYKENGPYTLPNAIGKLAPAQYGGISYEILASKGNDVYVISTGTFGRVGIYVPKDNDSTFTSTPTYK